MTETSPTAQRREVGTLLRAHRERVGLKIAEAAEHAGISAAKLSRLERGLRGLQVADVRTLCELYRLSDNETRELLSATRASREPGWWTSFSGLDTEAALYYGLEAAAVKIENFQALCIPGLLQTAEYARELISALRPDGGFSVDAIGERTEARLKRQSTLRTSSPRSFHFVIDEAALRRRVGNASVMAGQVRAIEAAAVGPNTAVQVMPFMAGAHPGMDGSFTIQRFEQTGLHDAVFVEGLAGNLIIDNEAQVALYREVFDHLVGRALSVEQTLDFLVGLGREWSTGPHGRDER